MSRLFLTIFISKFPNDSLITLYHEEPTPYVDTYLTTFRGWYEFPSIHVVDHFKIHHLNRHILINTYYVVYDN